MLKLILTGLDGRSWETEKIKQLEYSDRFDTPAQSLIAQTAAFRPGGELIRVRAEYGGEVFFEGPIDEQEWTADGRGERLEISARSGAAVLLDNEAIPARYNCPSLDDLYQLYLKPYGIRGYIGSGSRCGAWFPVQSGISEWEVVRNFCVGVLGVMPRITEDNLLDASGLPAERLILFDNREPGTYRYTSMTERYRRSGVIGEIAYRSESDGAYSYRAVNRTAAERKITARQVVGLADAADWEKNAVIGRRFMASEQGSRELALRSPQFVRCRPGDRARIKEAGGAEYVGWIVYEIRYILSGGAVISRVTLRPEDEIRGWLEDVADTAAFIPKSTARK